MAASETAANSGVALPWQSQLASRSSSSPCRRVTAQRDDARVSWAPVRPQTLPTVLLALAGGRQKRNRKSVELLTTRHLRLAPLCGFAGNTGGSRQDAEERADDPLLAGGWALNVSRVAGGTTRRRGSALCACRRVTLHTGSRDVGTAVLQTFIPATADSRSAGVASLNR